MDASSSKVDTPYNINKVVDGTNSSAKTPNTALEKTVRSIGGDPESSSSSFERPSSNLENSYHDVHKLLDNDPLSVTSEILRHLGDNLFFDYHSRRRVIVRWNDERHVFDVNDVSQKITNDALLTLHCSIFVYLGLQAVRSYVYS